MKTLKDLEPKASELYFKHPTTGDLLTTEEGDQIKNLKEAHKESIKARWLEIQANARVKEADKQLKEAEAQFHYYVTSLAYHDLPAIDYIGRPLDPKWNEKE